MIVDWIKIEFYDETAFWKNININDIRNIILSMKSRLDKIMALSIITHRLCINLLKSIIINVLKKFTKFYQK